MLQESCAASRGASPVVVDACIHESSRAVHRKKCQTNGSAHDALQEKVLSRCTEHGADDIRCNEMLGAIGAWLFAGPNYKQFTSNNTMRKMVIFVLMAYADDAMLGFQNKKQEQKPH